MGWNCKSHNKYSTLIFKGVNYLLLLFNSYNRSNSLMKLINIEKILIFPFIILYIYLR